MHPDFLVENTLHRNDSACEIIQSSCPLFDLPPPRHFESILLYQDRPKYMIRERDHPYESDLLYNTKPTPPVREEEESSFDLERTS